MDEHASSKLQTWIVVLLAWMIVLLMFGIGYLVYTNNQPEPEPMLTPTELTSACADIVDDAIAALPQEEPVVCPTVETYEGFGDITFDYPIDWDVVAKSNELADMTVIHLSEDPLWLCSGCDGPRNPLDITLQKNSAAKSLDTVVAERYTAANGYSGITKATATFKGKTAVTIKGKFDGMYTGTVDEIVYVTPATIVIISNDNYENDEDVTNAWTTLKASLDFSAVK